MQFNLIQIDRTEEMRDAENGEIRKKLDVNGDEVNGKYVRYEPQISFQGMRKSFEPEFPKFAAFKKAKALDSDKLEIFEESGEQRIPDEKNKLLDLGVFQKSKKTLSQFCVDSLAALTDGEFEVLTGLPNIDTFWQFFSLLDCDKVCPNLVYCSLTGEKSVSRSALYGSRHLANALMFEDELLLLLMKLRLNLVDVDLAQRFNIPTVVVTSLIITWIDFVYDTLVTRRKMPIFPSRHKVNMQLPKQFSQDYEFKNLRTLLIDVEVLGEKSHGSVYEMEPFSFTALPTSKVWAFTVGITPNGAANFISSVIQGSSKNTDLSKDVFDKLKSDYNKDDIVIGPEIPNCVQDCYGTIDIDYIVCHKFAKSPHMVLIRQLASKYLERLLSFKILSCIPCDLQPFVSKVVTVTVLLTNLNKPILQKK